MPLLQCLSAEDYNKFKILQRLYPQEYSSVDAKNKNNCKEGSLGVYYDDRRYNGVFEIRRFGRDRIHESWTLPRYCFFHDIVKTHTGSSTIIREDGSIWHNVSGKDRERFYFNGLSEKPDISGTLIRNEVRELVAGLTGRKSFENKNCRSIEKELKDRLKRDFVDGSEHMELAWFYATAKDQRFRRPKEAIKYAKKAFQIARRMVLRDHCGIQEQGIWDLDNYYITLAKAYSANGDFARALRYIEPLRYYSGAKYKAIKAMISQKS